MTNDQLSISAFADVKHGDNSAVRELRKNVSPVGASVSRELQSCQQHTSGLEKQSNKEEIRVLLSHATDKTSTVDQPPTALQLVY